MDIAGVVVAFETDVSVVDLLATEFSLKPIATAASPAVIRACPLRQLLRGVLQVARVLIIGASRGTGLETVKAADDDAFLRKTPVLTS